MSVLTDRKREKLGDINFWSVENVSHPVYDASTSCLGHNELSPPRAGQEIPPEGRVLSNPYSLEIEELEGSDNDHDEIPFNPDEFPQSENLLNEEELIPPPEEFSEESSEVIEMNMEAPNELITTIDKSQIQPNLEENIDNEELFQGMDQLF